MAKTNFKSVDEYVAAQPEAVRPILQRVRAGIRKAVPQAEEIISYQMPGYKLWQTFDLLRRLEEALFSLPSHRPRPRRV